MISHLRRMPEIHAILANTGQPLGQSGVTLVRVEGSKRKRAGSNEPALSNKELFVCRSPGLSFRDDHAPREPLPVDNQLIDVDA